MSIPQRKAYLTPEEYLRLEREADFKSQYLAGEMFPMAGGKPPHSLISAGIVASLTLRLRGHHCTAYESNLRVAVSPDGLYTYPDASVFCEPLTFVDDESDTATNPTLLVEVLSKSSEAFDRGKKFELYRQIATFREYLLVSQSEPLIERFHREDDGRWMLTSIAGMQGVVRLQSLEIDLPLAEVYEKVEFSDPTSGPGVA